MRTRPRRSKRAALSIRTALDQPDAPFSRRDPMPMTISTMALSKKAGMWWCDIRQERHADTIMQRLTIPKDGKYP